MTKTKEITYSLNKVKGLKVPANDKLEQKISLALPTDMPKGFCPWGNAMPNKQGEVTDAMRAMLLKPTPSYTGININSQYYLSVFHKHDAWNDIGEGTAIEIPITVLQGDANVAQP
jgi:hypothetical protein